MMMRRALFQCAHCSSKVIGWNKRAARLVVSRGGAHRPTLLLPNGAWMHYSSLPTPLYEAPNVALVKEDTKRLLEHVPVGSMKEHDWEQAYPSFLWWTQQGTPESVEMAWQLLDRLVEEEQYRHSSSGYLRSFWLNRIIETSRTVTRIDKRSVLYLVVGPMEWVERLDKYAPHLEPNAAAYSMIMIALTKWIDESTVELVESLLDRMEEQSKRNEQVLEADEHVAVYNAVLFAWANSGLEEAPRRAEAVFERMMKHRLEPDLRSYNSLITTWARSQDPNAGERAEHILRQMSVEGTEPNTAIYNAVIQTWERSKQANSPQRADVVFREMMNQYENGNAAVKPDATTFRIVIRKLVYNGQVGRADAVIRQMQHMYQDGHVEMKPDRKLFDAILHEWANARTPSAPQHAESFLRFMNDLYVSGDNDMKPNQWNFSAAIATRTKSSNYNSAVHAEALLDWMDEFRRAGDDKMVPNTLMCTSIISAWAKSRDETAPERAEALFQRMMEWYEAGNESVKPNLITYKSLINVWAKSRRTDAPERVEAIMRLLGGTDTEPDVACYNLLMNAYAKSKDRAAPERAEAILRHLIDRQQAGDKHMKPDIISFTTVMKAWANSKVEDAGERAEVFLRCMQDLYQETRDEDIKPNVVCFAVAIRAWINSGHPDAATRAASLVEEVHAKYREGDSKMKLKKQVYFEVMQLLAKSEEVDSGQVAERILLFMQDLGLAGDTHMLPGVKYFNLTLRAWSSSRHMLAAQRAEAILNLMKELRAQGVRPDLRPNRLSFNFTIKAWSKSSDIFAGRRAERHLHSMQELAAAGETDLAPNPFTYGDLAVAWKTSGHADAKEKAKKYEAISKAMYKEMNLSQKGEPTASE